MSEHSAHAKIMSLIGMEEFKQLSERLQLLADNRQRMNGVTIPLPNYLFAADRGCGVSTHLQLLTRQLQENKLIRFSGERPFFEWMLGPKDSEWSMDSLLHALDQVAGFHGRFRGVLGLEIDDWLGREQGSGFRQLLNLIEDKRGEILFVFVVQQTDEERIASLVRALSSAAPLETVRFVQPSNEELAAYLVSFLARRGFGISNQAKRELPAIMAALSATEGFDGLVSLTHLTDEIIYHACTRGRVAQAMILKDDLTFIQAGGGYCERMKNRSKRVIGFGG